MTAENRELIRQFYEELWNPFNKEKIPELLVEGIRFRGSLGWDTFGHAGFAEYMDVIEAAFPDFTNHIEEIIAEDDRAFARLTFRGTHLGAAFGVQPTGRHVEYAGAAVFRFRDGKIAGVWVLGDIYYLLQQLRAPAG